MLESVREIYGHVSGSQKCGEYGSYNGLLREIREIDSVSQREIAEE